MNANERADAIVDALARDLQGVSGVAAIVLGGSRARGTHTEQSDVDLALYYWPDRPLDLAALAGVAMCIDDRHRADVLTEIGGWGPWINGGGWLTVRAVSVELLYRDLQQVTATVHDCLAGRSHIAYQPGHPHGFVTEIYLAEIALCRVLWDPAGAIAALKRAALPYPQALKDALIRKFFWEADFSLKVAEKAIVRQDVSYITGCCFRCVSCLLQTLFALNGCYWMNEKGAVALAGSFVLTPPRLEERIDAAFQRLAPAAAELASAIQDLERLVQETARLLAQADPSA